MKKKTLAMVMAGDTLPYWDIICVTNATAHL